LNLATDLAAGRQLVRVVENAMPWIRRSWHLLQESSKFVEIDQAMFDRCRL
jgi:hypothetical protein